MIENSGYWALLTNTDWKEPWLIFLLLMHLATAVSIFTITKSHANVQIIIFIVLLSGAYFSENINELAAKHWRKFSKQHYFDSNGFFISTVFSIPILLNCMLIISWWLYSSTQLMKKVKIAQHRLQLRREQQERKNKAE